MRRIKSIIGLILIAVLVMSGGANCLGTGLCRDYPISVSAAVSAPQNVSLSLKKSGSKMVAKASWSGSAPLYSYTIYNEDDFGGYSISEGTTSAKSVEYEFTNQKEGDVFTYGIKVSAYDYSGNTSKKVGKTKTYYMTGKNTKKIKKLVSKKTKGMSTFKKIKYAHDWIVKNYDYGNSSSNAAYTFAGTYKAKKGVCQGYTLTFQVFMKEMGIPVRCVIGNDHAWNLVKVGGKWYHIDCTWDDPVGLEDITAKHPSYSFFLQSSKNIKKKGGSEHAFKASDYPKAKSTTYDNEGSSDGYKESVPGNSRAYANVTFHPWKNGKMI